MSDNDHVSEPFPRSLRADLLTVRPNPMPPMAWPRALRWLPHVLVVLGAAALSATGDDDDARVLAAAHAAAIVVALRRPALAWWLSLGFVVGIAASHPPTPDNQLWAWLVHASVIFLLTLRVRPASAAVAAGVSALVAVALKLAGCPVGSWQLVLGAVASFAVALLLGAVGRGRREDRARLTAQIAATAQERARRTVLEERTRIARELHDVVAHHMSVISIKAEAAPYRVQDPPAELVAEFAAIRAGAVQGLNELRHLLGVLRSDASGDGPATAPQPSLAQLDALLANVRAAGLTVTARVDGTPRPLSPGVELSAYRIVQEALSNVLRHAPGAAAEVGIAYRGAALRLRVANGPAARTARPSPGSGHGVTGMRERAAMLGGELAAGRTPDGGYEISAVLPAPATEEDTSP
ncbi:sensor histidine kinase [Nonomuraea sediminis]|uniref:sensor histidine kinase n=1 Tax=Nonomuraea sediminis TaxID=2835864 RepID=UPI001BDCC45D|nr:sensor histidine kinase [Nonomuraea sediminis]